MGVRFASNPLTELELLILAIIFRRGWSFFLLGEVDDGIAILLSAESLGLKLARSNEVEFHIIEQIVEVFTRDVLDVHALDVGRSELLGAHGSLARNLQAELTQFAKVHLLTRFQGRQHRLYGGDKHRRHVRAVHGTFTCHFGGQLFQRELAVDLRLGIRLLFFILVLGIAQQSCPS